MGVEGGGDTARRGGFTISVLFEVEPEEWGKSWGLENPDPTYPGAPSLTRGFTTGVAFLSSYGANGNAILVHG